MGSTVTIVTIQAVKSGKDQIYLARQVCKVCTYFEFVSPFVVTAIGVKIKQQAISSFEVYALQEKDSSASEEMLRCLAFFNKRNVHKCADVPLATFQCRPFDQNVFWFHLNL